MLSKRTKIICTLGPASNTDEVLEKLARAGMNIARLNMSHGTQEEKARLIKMIRDLSKKLDTPIGLFTDLQGPKLRLGQIDGIIEIKKGDKIALSYTPKAGEIPTQFDLSPFLQKNHRVYLNDGLLSLKVASVSGKTINTIALNDGWISSNKGINIPDTHLRGAGLTEKDMADALFSIKQDVDYIALSFVQSPDEVYKVRELIKKHNGKAKVIVKVEKPEAIERLEEIIEVTDAVMVARGDLAIETSPAEVPIIQQKITRIARQKQKPVIVATQMLESMTENPRPTRAEVSDVANAVLDQVDAVMLSAESASGKYPVETVEIMNEIINSVEQNPDYKNLININMENFHPEDYPFAAIASSAAHLAKAINARYVVIGTKTGRTARLLSSFRPDAKILAVAHDEIIKNQLVLLWGVKPMIIKPTNSPSTFWKEVVNYLNSQSLLKKADQIVIVSGSQVGTSGLTDTIKVVTV